VYRIVLTDGLFFLIFFSLMFHVDVRDGIDVQPRRGVARIADAGGSGGVACAVAAGQLPRARARQVVGWRSAGIAPGGPGVRAISRLPSALRLPFFFI
jgi:hypothetical protein